MSEYLIYQQQTGAFTYVKNTRTYSPPMWGVSHMVNLGDRQQTEQMGWFGSYEAAADYVKQLQAGDAARSVK
jgi:hypothetical protein